MSNRLQDPLQHKLEAYRRKFYLNQVLRGVAVLAVCCSALLLLFSLTEGLLWMGSGMRTALALAVLLLCGTLAVRWVLLPLASFAHLGRVLGDEQLARQLGASEPQVADKLVNYLQLRALTTSSSDLLLAALQHRAAALNQVSFTAAINYRLNLRIARWLVVPLLAAALILWWDAPLLTQGSYRLAHFSEPFYPPPPFTIAVQGAVQQLVAGDSNTIAIQVVGKALPAELALYLRHTGELDFQPYPLQKLDPGSYSYTFKAVQKSWQYYIGNAVHRSQTYNTQVLQRPSITSFTIKLYYPAYTGLPPEQLPANVGDFSALLGTRVQLAAQYNGNIRNAGFVYGARPEAPFLLDKTGHASVQWQVRATGIYKLMLHSPEGIVNRDTVAYQVTALPDKYPTVTLLGAAESLVPATGIVGLDATAVDDYGFSKAVVQYRILIPGNNTPPQPEELPLPLQEKGKLVQLTTPLDVLTLGLQPGQALEYSVQVWDNDAVSGPKSASSVVHTLRYASAEAVLAEIEQSDARVEGSLGALAEQARQNAKALAEAKRKLFEKRGRSYEDRKQLEQLLQRQQDQEKQLQAAQQALEKIEQLSTDNRMLSPNTEKQLQAIQKLLEQTQDPAMQEFLKAMQEQLKQADPRPLQNNLNQLQQRNERLQQDINRIQELFKQWKVDQKAEEVLKRVEQLATQQENIGQKTPPSSPNELPALQQAQQQLAQDAKRMQEALTQLEQLKQQTRTPDAEQLQQLKQEGTSAQQQMEQAAQQLQQNNRKQASQAQQQAQQQLQQLSKQLQQLQKDAAQRQNTENYQDVRNLLENLLKLSFDQENLRDELEKLRFSDPSLKQKAQQQSKFRDEMVLIKDSLVALSKRVVQIKKLVLDELQAIDRSMDQSVDLLADRNVPRAISEQHTVMTHLNTLANMLVASLDNMQASMRAQAGNNSGMPMPMPGSLRQLAQQQQQLNNELGQLQQGPQGQSLQEQAAAQEKIRLQLKAIYDKLREQGGKGGLGNLDKVMGDMETTEKELLERKLTAQTLQRQQQILNRMLDYDKALREREYEEKRQSRTGSPLPLPPTGSWNDSLLQDPRLREELQRNKLQLTPEYQQRTDEYFQQLPQH